MTPRRAVRHGVRLLDVRPWIGPPGGRLCRRFVAALFIRWRWRSSTGILVWLLAFGVTAAGRSCGKWSPRRNGWRASCVSPRSSSSPSCRSPSGNDGCGEPNAAAATAARRRPRPGDLFALTTLISCYRVRGRGHERRQVARAAAAAAPASASVRFLGDRHRFVPALALDRRSRGGLAGAWLVAAGVVDPSGWHDSGLPVPERRRLSAIRAGGADRSAWSSPTTCSRRNCCFRSTIARSCFSPIPLTGAEPERCLPTAARRAGRVPQPRAAVRFAPLRSGAARGAGENDAASVETMRGRSTGTDENRTRASAAEHR